MGGTVGWDGASQQIAISVNGHNISMWLNKTDFTADGKDQIMDVAPVSINGRTMVPVRFAAENAGCQVDWEDAAKQIYIIYYIDRQSVVLDETKQNPNALFRLGMTRDDCAKANDAAKFNVRSQAGDYIEAPPMFFSFTDNKIDQIRWDGYGAVKSNIPNINGFGFRSTIGDVERILGKPLAACAQDTSIIYLYYSGGQYTEFYADIKSPFHLNSISVTSTLDKCIANPQYDDYPQIKAIISGN